MKGKAESRLETAVGATRILFETVVRFKTSFETGDRLVRVECMRRGLKICIDCIQRGGMMYASHV